MKNFILYFYNYINNNLKINKIINYLKNLTYHNRTASNHNI